MKPEDSMIWIIQSLKESETYDNQLKDFVGEDEFGRAYFNHTYRLDKVKYEASIAKQDQQIKTDKAKKLGTRISIYIALLILLLLVIHICG